MKFKCEHVCQNTDLVTYEQTFFDTGFNDALCDHVKLKRELLEEHRDEQSYKRIAKIYPDRELPGPLKKLVPADQFSYTEHVTYTWGSRTAQWHIELPAMIADKVSKAEGTYIFTETGDGVSRVVEGEIVVKIFGIGKIVEKFLAEQIESSYDKAADFTQTWINNNG